MKARVASGAAAPAEPQPRPAPVRRGITGVIEDDSGEGHRLSSRGYRVLVLGLLAAVALSLVLGVVIGAVAVAPDDIWAIIRDHVFGVSPGSSYSRVADQIVWRFRLPRALLAAVIGAGLALVGTVMQALCATRWPIPTCSASPPAPHSAPSSCSLWDRARWAAVAVGSGVPREPAGAGDGLRDRAAPRPGHSQPADTGGGRARLPVSGRVQLRDPKSSSGFDGGAQQVLYWLLGSLSGARWPTVGIPSVVVLTGLALLMVQFRPMNALLAGEETAVSLGVDLARFRLLLFLVTSVLVEVMVAASGAIASVGLILPHIARLVVGSDHRRVLPTAALGGAVFLQLVDIVARTADQPNELPLSIVTAFVGVPFFVWLLRRRDRSDALSVT